MTKRLLAMEYIDGIKLTEMGRDGAEIGGDGDGQATVETVVHTLVEYYGMTMHGPIFNTDPHPGNLLVEKSTGALVTYLLTYLLTFLLT